jgi:hypothetical protein
MRARSGLIGVALLAVLAAGAPAAAGQTQAPPPAPPPVPRTQTPQELERIREALKRPNTIIMDDNQVRSYLEIRAKYPTVEEMFRGVDLLSGPRQGGPAFTHAEYLGMVTPRDMVASSGGIKPMEMLQFAVTNWLGQMLVRKALQEVHDAKSAGEIEKIRARIDKELAALTGKSGG